MLLRKGVYPYEHMESWGKFNEKPLPNKKAFRSELNLKDISDKEYAHAQKVWDVSGIKTLDEYRDLYVQSDTLLLADVFEKFRNKCIEIYGLDPAHFFDCARISMANLLKKDRSKIKIINRY